MAVGDWSAATLAVEADVTSRYTKAASLLEQTEAISDFIAIAKSEIGERLDVWLREKRSTISETDLADLKDLLANPTVFKSAAVAFTLYRMHEKNIYEPEDFHTQQARIYYREYQDKFDQAIALVQLDTDNSGAIEDVEAATAPTMSRFQRA